MNDIIKNIEAAQLKETVPVFHVGDTVKVYNKIKEGTRERIQIFEGTVIKRQNGGARETFKMCIRDRDSTTWENRRTGPCDVRAWKDSKDKSSPLAGFPGRD